MCDIGVQAATARHWREYPATVSFNEDFVLPAILVSLKSDSCGDYATILVITKDGGTVVATYQVMYWQNIPSQIKVRDENGTVKKMLPARFQEAIDSAAVAAGRTETDA